MKKDEVLDALKKALRGLVYTSETDAKMQPIVWQDDGALTPARMLELSRTPQGTAIEKSSLESFFRVVPAADKAGFDRLALVLKEHLTGVKVYKVGAEAAKQVYVVGKTTDGRVAGFKTTVVET